MNKKSISALTITLSLVIGGFFTATKTVSSYSPELPVVSTNITKKTVAKNSYQKTLKKIDTQENEEKAVNDNDKKVTVTTHSNPKKTNTTSKKEEVKQSVQTKPVQEASQKETVNKPTKKEEPKQPSQTKPVEQAPKKETPKTEVPKNETVEESSAVSQAQLNQLNNKAVALINSIRPNHLAVNGTLNSFASTRAKEASVKWSHTRPNGTRGVNMIDSSKYRGENLAKTVAYDFGGTDQEINAIATRLFNNWKNSSSHYQNMTYDQFTQIGLKTYVVVEGNKYIFYTAAMFSN